MKKSFSLFSLFFLIIFSLSNAQLSSVQNIILEDGLNNLDLTPETTVILTYTPHISKTQIKFPLIVSAPYCIQSFSSLSQIDVKDICDQSATIGNFQVSLNNTSPIYFRISTTSNTTLQITVTTPVVNMSPSAPFVYISCQDNCYTLVHINCTERSCPILAGGDGYISTLDSDVGQNKINLDRSGVYTIKARLENGGNLWIEMADVSVVVIGKQKSNVQVTFGVQVIVPISQVSQLNSLLINSFSSSFFVSAQCYSLNISDSIYTKYDYPSPSSTKLLETNSKMSSVTKIDFNNLNVINKNCQQSGVKCFLTVGIFKTEEINFPFVTDTDDFYLSTNSQIHQLQLNSPSYLTSYFSQQRFMVLPSSTQNYEIVPQKVSLKLLSACGNINQQITQMKDTQSNNIVPYFNTITGAACAYVTTIGLCKLPYVIAGIPQQILVPGQKSHYRSTFITNSSELHISVWGEVGNKAIKVNLYLISSQQDCISEPKSEQLVDSGSFTYDEKKQIFSHAGEQMLKMIVPTKAQGKLLMFIVQPSDNAGVDLWLSVNQQNTIPVFIPNSASIPLQTHHETYSYYSNQMNWTICANSLQNFHFDVSVSFQSKHVANGSMSLQKNCFSVLNSVEYNIEAQEPSIQKYTLTFTITQGKAAQIYVNIVEKPQFIEVNDDTITYQPGNLVQSNGIFGKCYMIQTDEKTDFLLYFAESQKYIPTVQTSSKSINVTQISETGYRIAVQPNSKDNKYIQVCVAREEIRGKDDGDDEGYYLGVQIQSMNYNLISNDELVSGVTFLNSIGSISFSTLQAYRYINMHLPKSQYSDYLITELIQCQSSPSPLTLLASSDFDDIQDGSVATFSEFYTNHFFSVGLSELPQSGQYFLGIQSNSDRINFLLRTTATSSNQLQHLSWVFNSTIEKAQSTDGKYLIVQLVQPKSKNLEKLSDYKVLYTITVIDKSQTDYKLRQSYAKCPQIFPVVDNITVVKQINPSLPIFKIEVEKLKSSNVQIFAKVEMQKNTGGSFNLYYEPSSISLQQTQNDEKQNSKFSLGFVFLTITISIFLVLLIRFTIKVIRNRSSSNTVQFELSQQNRPFDSQRQTNSNSNASQNVDERRATNQQKREYQDFVDEEIHV